MNHAEHSPAWRATLTSLAVLSALSLSACSSLRPMALETQELASATRADAEAIRKGVDPMAGPLGLNEAMARALKYNLDRRARMMEEALALRQLDVANKADMLPKLMADAGYRWRSNDSITQSRDVTTGALSPSRFVSQERQHTTHSLEFSWSLIDLGLGYYGARQQADRVLIAGEKRRKAMHLLMQDVRTAYWRAAAAQRLKPQVDAAIALAEDALRDARTSAGEKVRNPLDSLRYQRQLLENMRLLEAIGQELSAAKVELASLVNAPLGQELVLADMDAPNIAEAVIKLPVEKLEDSALANNADLRESHYNARLAREEVRRTIARLFPNVSFNVGSRYDSDNYLVNRDWQDAGLQISFNLLNLFSGPVQVRMAEAGVSLADQRRVAMQLGVLTQLHVARVTLINARAQFERADAIYTVDTRIAELIKSRESAQATSKLEAVANSTSAILSLLRRYQALAQVQAAENRLVANLGLEPQVGSVDDLSLPDLTELIRRQSNPWSGLLGTTAGATQASDEAAANVAAAAGAAEPLSATATPDLSGHTEFLRAVLMQPDSPVPAGESARLALRVEPQLRTTPRAPAPAPAAMPIDPAHFETLALRFLAHAQRESFVVSQHVSDARP